MFLRNQKHFHERKIVEVEAISKAYDILRGYWSGSYKNGCFYISEWNLPLLVYE